MALPELDSEKGKVTRAVSILVDKAPLSERARSGIDPRRSRQAAACVIGVGLACQTASGAAWRAI